MVQKMRREQFVTACVLSGCDYIKSIKGLGLKVAIKLLNEHKTIEHVIEALRLNKTFTEKVPEGYEE